MALKLDLKESRISVSRGDVPNAIAYAVPNLAYDVTVVAVLALSLSDIVKLRPRIILYYFPSRRTKFVASFEYTLARV